MVEKRFGYVAFDGFEDNGEYITPYQVVGLLNELHEENKELMQKQQEMRVLLTKIEREFRERGILTEEEFMRLLE